MRKVTFYTFTLLLVFSSCQDFLTYKDKDKIVPVTLENFSELAYTELMANSNSAETDYLNVMTDDIESEVVPLVSGSNRDYDSRDIYINHFKWSPETQFTELNKEREDLSWNTIYRRILIANVIEDKMLTDFDDDVSGIRQRLLGEVKFIRAMSYFTLINLYAAPYLSAEDAKVQLAVPINSSSTIDIIQYRRSTMEKVCALIEKDLNESIAHFKLGQKRDTKFRPNIDASRLYLSRLYLYTKQWTKVVEVTNQFISETSAEIMTKDRLKQLAGSGGILQKNSKSVIFTWGATKALDYADNATSNRGRFVRSQELLSKYITDDIRLKNFFKDDYQSLKVFPFKFDRWSGSPLISSNTIRYEEIYFNRAEANLELGNIADAMSDINFIRKERIDGNYVVSASDYNTATSYFRDEKRREFCFEGLRWFDIRRWNLTITHIYQNFADPKSVQIYKLKPSNYIMPLPLNLVRKNPDIEKFTREECLTN